MESVINKLKGKLVVSCQAEGESPFNSVEGILLMTKAALLGGAAAIMVEDYKNIKAVLNNFDIPVIGIIKGEFPDGSLRITGSTPEVEKLLKIGCDIIAVDGTFREREGKTGPEFIKSLKYEYKDCIVADISTYEEGMACAEAGADAVSTKLAGLTPETGSLGDEPDFSLLAKLVRDSGVPVIAEGRFNTPAQAARAMDEGAWAVVVGSAISRPSVVTGWFANAISKSGKSIIKENE